MPRVPPVTRATRPLLSSFAIFPILALIALTLFARFLA
jgi:hypothetical protein